MVVFRRTISLLLVALLLNGHWAALQSVAWARMLAERVKTMCVNEAVTSTFDGEHPCAMCVAIQKAKAAERSEEARCKAFVESRLLPAVLPSAAKVFPPPILREDLRSEPFSWTAIPQEPAVPPPRVG
jgi:hypothetical protein